jgi:hypothetical protein
VPLQRKKCCTAKEAINPHASFVLIQQHIVIELPEKPNTANPTSVVGFVEGTNQNVLSPNFKGSWKSSAIF